jgi:hypothetical protein
VAACCDPGFDAGVFGLVGALTVSSSSLSSFAVEFGCCARKNPRQLICCTRVGALVLDRFTC